MASAKGDSTHREILREALALASEGGLGSLSLGALAERVGMSKSGLFAHVASRENLEVLVLDEAVSRFTDLVVAPALKKPRGEPRLRALFDRWLAWGKADFMPGGCIFFAAAAELDDKPGPARDRLVASQRDWLEALATATKVSIAEGHFRSDVDPYQVAHEIYALGYGHHALSRLFVDPRTEARTRLAFERLVTHAQAPSSKGTTS